MNGLIQFKTLTSPRPSPLPPRERRGGIASRLTVGQASGFALKDLKLLEIAKNCSRSPMARLRVRICRNAFSRFKFWNRGGDQSRAGVPPALRARQREQAGGGAIGGRRDARPTLRFMGRGGQPDDFNNAGLQS